MLDFIVQHWTIFVYVGCALIELVILLVFKKRPKVIDNSILLKVAEWIEEAEVQFRQGKDKLDYVCQKAANYLGDLYSEKDIVSLVEWLLTLPEKKGGKK